MNHFLTRLEGKLLAVLETNPSANLPYHNNEHMKQMWALARTIWEREEEDVGLGDSTWNYVVLMFACLFHDWDHSGGHDSDHYNVLRAREFVEELIAKNGYTLPGRVIKAIDDAIAVTEFPFVIQPKNRLEAVIRDADSLYATHRRDPTVIIDGLRQEMEVKFGNAISDQQMLDGHIDFMAKTTMFTKTAHDIWAANAQPFVEDLKRYVKERGN